MNHSSQQLPPLTRLSIVIPARNEEEALPPTLTDLHQRLQDARIPHEILVVNDGSTDRTAAVLEDLATRIPELRPLHNPGPHGFGRAIIYGLNAMKGDAVVVVMADASDHPDHVVRYWEKLNEGYECVFGSRFIAGGEVHDYPKVKLFINRIANKLISVLFRIPLNDTTNAFKAYRREVIEGCRPFLAPHFNLTIEIPLKAIVRGFSWTIVPISWHNRKTGEAKLKIREMGSRYFFIMAYVWLEKYFSRGDYRRDQAPVRSTADSSSRNVSETKDLGLS